MNLFRSEEHIRNWSRFVPGTEDAILPLADIAVLFSGEMFRRRLDPDYVTKCQIYFQQFIGELEEISRRRPFWNPRELAEQFRHLFEHRPGEGVSPTV